MTLEIYSTLLKCVFITQAAGSYYVSDNQITWNDAIKTHTLARPDIQYNVHNLSINIDIGFENADVWIGYFKAFTAFEYFGCMQKESISSSKTFMLDRNGPGLCFSACGKQILVGLGGEMCYCLENEPTVNHHLPNCDKECEAENAFLCGGDEHISLYKVNEEVIIRSNIDDNNCLLTEHLTQYYALIWESCGLAYQTMCTFVNGTILTDGQYYNWKDATKKCFQLNGFATSYANTTFNLDQLPRGISWTGVIRSYVIYRYNEIDIGSFNKIECGYINTGRVLFTENCNSPLKKALYRYETSSTVTHTATSEISITDGSTTEMALSTSLTEAITSLSSNVSTGKESDADTDQQEVDSKGSDVSVIIGASAASVLVVIAVVVVVFAILKRRNRKKNQSEHQTKAGYRSEQNDYITPISTEAIDKIYTIATDNGTGSADDGYEIPNPRRNVYESLHDSGNHEHCYETTITNFSGS